MTGETLGRRHAQADDLPFLRQVYASTRVDEFAMVPWSREERDAFLGMQFDLQHAQLEAHYPEADFLILTLAEQPVGRLYVFRGPGELFLIDIALLPEHRGAGHGTRLLRGLCDEAARAGIPLRLYVDKGSKALHLYRRLDFRIIGEHSLYWHMEWRADDAGREPRTR